MSNEIQNSKFKILIIWSFGFNKTINGGTMSKSRSFTLIEILVVVFIIGLLASLIIINLASTRANARDAKRISDLTTVASALQLYYADKHEYPLQRSGNDCEKFNSLVDDDLYAAHYLEGTTAKNKSTTDSYCLKYQSTESTTYRLFFVPEVPNKNTTCKSPCTGAPGSNNYYLIKNGEVADTW
jgi:prepilin-type N-terminal cleavage/methylation domain-containing protein